MNRINVKDKWKKENLNWYGIKEICKNDGAHNICPQSKLVTGIINIVSLGHLREKMLLNPEKQQGKTDDRNDFDEITDSDWKD